MQGDNLEDFHLVYEARCFGNNSSVMYRSEVVDDKKFVMRGSQCDLHPNPPYLAIDLTDNDKNRIRSGKIGLQLHAGKPMKVDFRNIRLKHLK